MQYFYPAFHALHTPSIDLSDGLPGYKHLEVSSRVELILEGLLRAKNAEVVRVDTLAQKEVLNIHDKDYVEFLLEISQEIEGEEEYVPPIFREDLSASPLYFRGGMYCKEIGTPIGKESIKAALNSAATALSATEYMLQGKRSSFVLTRPPGHHAGKRRYGGYCFFNNAYLAAHEFLKYGKKIAVIDIDYHIGDGSLEFASVDAPYYSLHANTTRNYPYLDANFDANCATKNEHVTLEEFEIGISGEVYVKNVREFVKKALQKSADIVILSLGFDTLGTDYTQDEYIYVNAEDYRAIGAIFGVLEQEVMILLEGGYDSEYLELCAFEFMSGFLQAKDL
ncbi:hypothetical protein JHD47_08855 [Sulfurimonas sp. SAG-AH-194-L11]|nr:hypothetical protein [Sulfurimonas sp. SAG-AH-194-L11]MDF1877922.1 hypothetical protein [Sulfurimonas sp. SAG-AH-194-L11]